MSHRTTIPMSAFRPSLLAAKAACAALSLAFMSAAAAATLPDTAVGKLGGDLIHHVNSDSPEQIRDWASTILSPAVSAAEKADFLASLTAAVRDAGGVEVADVRPHPRQPGLLQLVVKARRGGRSAMLMLAADPAQPDRLAQAGMFPMDDPALYATWPNAAVSPEAMKRLVATTLDQLVRSSDFSGCVTVMQAGETVVDECRGLAERRFGVPVDRQTRFHIASLGKMFTAVAVAQLVEAGKLSWEATLDQLLPDYPDQPAAKKITVWQLAHHTAGLGDFMVPEFFEQREKFVDPADYLDLISRQPTLGEPGEEWNYSNAGYVLLGRIIEHASGEGYFDYIQRHVFAPAGMTASGFDSPEDIVPKLAVGYFHRSVFSTDWKADWFKAGFKGSPAGGGYSNNTDLLRFASALRAGKLVKPATLATMFDDAVPAGPGVYAAGFGERVSNGRHIRGHAGGIEGTDANLQMVWESQAAVALTSNQGPSQTWMLAERIADLLAASGEKP